MANLLIILQCAINKKNIYSSFFYIVIYCPSTIFQWPFQVLSQWKFIMVFQIFKISASHLDARSLVHHWSRKSSAVTRDSRKYNYILIRFDINYSQIVFPPGCEKLSLEIGKNYYDFAETKTLQFNSFNTKASFTMKLYRYNVNEKSFPINYLMRGISVYKKW